MNDLADDYWFIEPQDGSEYALNWQEQRARQLPLLLWIMKTVLACNTSIPDIASLFFSFCFCKALKSQRYSL